MQTRLAELEAAGVLTRTVHVAAPGRRPLVEYELTPKGRALQPVTDALAAWGEAHSRGPRASERRLP